MKCTRTITWKDFDGSITSVTSDEHPTPDAASAEAEEMAAHLGWTPRRWWQWWRWDEQVEPHEATLRSLHFALLISNGLVSALLAVIVVLLMEMTK